MYFDLVWFSSAESLLFFFFKHRGSFIHIWLEFHYHKLLLHHFKAHGACWQLIKESRCRLNARGQVSSPVWRNRTELYWNCIKPIVKWVTFLCIFAVLFGWSAYAPQECWFHYIFSLSSRNSGVRECFVCRGKQ